MKGSNTAGKIGEEPSLPKNITMKEKRVPHEHLNLYNNFTGMLIQEDKRWKRRLQNQENKLKTNSAENQITDQKNWGIIPGNTEEKGRD